MVLPLISLLNNSHEAQSCSGVFILDPKIPWRGRALGQGVLGIPGMDLELQLLRALLPKILLGWGSPKALRALQHLLLGPSTLGQKGFVSS